MKPNFQVFRKGSRSTALAGQLTATILRGGNISLNRAAHHALGEPDAVELLYDRTDRIIGLRPVPREVPHAYPVQSRGSVRVVAGRAFAQHFGIDAAVSTRWAAYMDGGVLCIDLKRGGQVVSRTPTLAEGGAR